MGFFLIAMIQPRPINLSPDPPPLHNPVEDSLLTDIGPLPSGFSTVKSQPVLTQHCNQTQVHASAHSATQENFQHPSNQTFFSTGHTKRVTPFPLPCSPQQTQSPATTARATFPPNQTSSATWHPRIRLAYAAPHTPPSFAPQRVIIIINKKPREPPAASAQRGGRKGRGER